MRIILPKTHYEANFEYGPLFFLAGPVRGGADWQANCCDEIEKYFDRFHAAVPCQYRDGKSRLLKHKVSGDTTYFDRQLTWERHYLDIASEKGCIIFWLPCEDKSFPRNDEDGPYAMDTRGELGEWRGRMMHNPKLRVVIGAQKDFPGLSQIQRNFNFALGYDFPIYETLEETVAAAVEKVKQ